MCVPQGGGGTSPKGGVDADSQRVAVVPEEGLVTTATDDNIADAVDEETVDI